MDFGRVLGSQNGRKIKNLADFLSMLLETSFLVEFCWIFDKNDGDKHMEFSLFFNMLFHHLFAKFAVFWNARNLKNSDFPLGKMHIFIKSHFLHSMLKGVEKLVKQQ